MPPVVFTDVTHQRWILTLLLKTGELDQMHRMEGAFWVLLGLFRDWYSLVFGECSCWVSLFRALHTQVGATDNAENNGGMEFILITGNTKLKVEENTLFHGKWSFARVIWHTSSLSKYQLLNMLILHHFIIYLPPKTLWKFINSPRRRATLQLSWKCLFVKSIQ